MKDNKNNQEKRRNPKYVSDMDKLRVLLMVAGHFLF